MFLTTDFEIRAKWFPVNKHLQNPDKPMMNVLRLGEKKTFRRQEL
jgi:hypothetical protein